MLLCPGQLSESKRNIQPNLTCIEIRSRYSQIHLLSTLSVTLSLLFSLPLNLSFLEALCASSASADASEARWLFLSTRVANPERLGQGKHETAETTSAKCLESCLLMKWP